MEYLDQLEESYAARLAALVPLGFKVEVLPDNQKDRDRPSGQGRVTVAYEKTRYGDKTSPGTGEILSLGAAHQVQYIHLSITVEARKRRGDGGVFVAEEAMRRLLMGWKPAEGYRQTSGLSFELVDYRDSYFVYQYNVITSRASVPALDDRGLPGGLTENDYLPPGPLFAEGRLNDPE